MTPAGQPRRGVAIIVFAAVRTVIVVPLFFLFTGLLALIVVVIAKLPGASTTIERMVRMWMRMWFVVAPMSFEVEGRERVRPDLQYVFVANHLSNFDIPVIFLAAPVPVRFLSKKEVYRLPFIAQAMNVVGMIKVDREASGRAQSVLNDQVAAVKARGHSLAIFAEGTRSSDGKLGPFKKGAFRIAIANDLPVVPVTIRGTWEVWPPGSKFFYPGRAKAVIHDPIPTADLDVGDIGALRDQARTAVITALPTDLVNPEP